MTGPRIGSLCSGYGGLDQGVQAALGGETVWVSDIDKGACKILAHRYPNVPNIGDMTKVDWSRLNGRIDIITAGYPCQPFSHAGNRKGTDDERHLWPYVREAIRVLRPRLAVLENVAGHRSLGFDRVLGDLAEDGLHVWWTSIRASDIGAAHRRERLFIFAAANPGRELRQISNSRQLTAVPQLGGTGATGPTLFPTPRATDGTKGGPNQRGSSGDLMPPSAVTLLPTPAVNDMGEGKTVDAWDEWTSKMQAAHSNGNGHGKSLSIEAQRLLPTPMVGDAASARNSTATRHKITPTGIHAGDTLTDIIRGAQAWGDYTTAITRWEQTLGRPAPAPTQTSAKGNPQLAPAFVEWLMGLPAGWVTDVPGITRNEALKALGNGVVPQQAEAAIRWLLTQTEAAA